MPPTLALCFATLGEDNLPVLALLAHDHIAKFPTTARHPPRRSHNCPVSEISLSGGEITILKTLGLSGASLAGEQLVERTDDMETAEFLDTLDGLMSLDYVTSNKVNIRTMDDVQKATFRVNPAHVKDLKDAVYPSRKKPETRRRRRS